MTRLAARVVHALRRWGWCVDDVTLDDAINELRGPQPLPAMRVVVFLPNPGGHQ